MGKPISQRKRKEIKNLRARIRYAEKQGFIFPKEFKENVQNLTPKRIKELRGEKLQRKSEVYQTPEGEMIPPKQGIKYRKEHKEPRDIYRLQRDIISTVVSYINNVPNADKAMQEWYLMALAKAIQKYGVVNVATTLAYEQQSTAETLEAFLSRTLQYKYSTDQAQANRQLWYQILNNNQFLTIEESQVLNTEFEELEDRYSNIYNTHTGDTVDYD